MISANLPYGQRIYVQYTSLSGLECGEICETQWLKKIIRRSKRRLAFTSEFPFLKLHTIYYSDVILEPITSFRSKHIYALESLAMMARQFGIKCTDDTTSTLLKDQLENGI